MNDVNLYIFREYDIRGKVDVDLNENTAEIIGKAFGTYIQEVAGNFVVIGRDNRPSSSRFKQNLSKGLQSTGCRVMDLGLVPTPVFYFGIHKHQADGGVMVTASHNPPEFNGFKLNKGLMSLYGPEINGIGLRCNQGKFKIGIGSESADNPIPDYIETILQRITLKRKLRVALDCGNAMGGVVAPTLLKKLGCEVYELFCDLDERFPNHHPDPTVISNLDAIRKLVQKEKLELGIALDGDADRIGVIDENSQPIFGDMILLLLAKDLLSRHPGTPVVFEVKCSQVLIDEIKKAGGIPIMGKAGHSLIKKRMKEEHALLAGEMSGHMFFGENYFGYDDAIFAAAKILEILSRSEQPLSAYFTDLPKTCSTPEIRIDCPDEKKFQVVKTLTDEFRKEYPINDIDGVRITFPHGWGLVRPSNTQPVLVLRFEAPTKEELQEYQRIMLEKMKPFGLKFSIQ